MEPEDLAFTAVDALGDVPPDEDHTDHVHVPFTADDDVTDSPAERVRRMVRGVAGKKAPARKASARKRAVEPRIVVPIDVASMDVLKDTLTQSYVFVGGIVSLIDEPCGMAIGENAPVVAEAWIQLASNNPAVARALNALSTGGGALAVLAAHLPIVLMVAAHHGPANPVITHMAAEANPQTFAKVATQTPEPPEAE